MSDQDNYNEDRFIAKEARETASKADSIQFHTDNWIDAVTKSPQRSHGTFASVIDCDASKLLESGYAYRKPTSADVFVERMVEGDFMERAAQILIDYNAGKSFTQAAVDKLFKDMAQDYAEFQYDSQIKD